MRTKQKARRRVSSFDSLESATEGSQSNKIDVEGQSLVNDLRNVSEKACTSRYDVASIYSDIGSVNHESSQLYTIDAKK